MKPFPLISGVSAVLTCGVTGEGCSCSPLSAEELCDCKLSLYLTLLLKKLKVNVTAFIVLTR